MSNIKITSTLTRRQGSGLCVKTFLFNSKQAAQLDDAVNSFAAAHWVVRITAIRSAACIGYAVVYIDNDPSAQR